MPVKIPTNKVLSKLSSDLGLSLSNSDLQICSEFMGQMAESFERLEAISGPTLHKPVRGKIGRPPNEEENPYGAWSWLGKIGPTSSGLLDGFDVGIKDAICVAGMPTQNGSKLLSDFIPEFDATVVTRILEAGGTIVGKTACENLSFSGHSHTSKVPVQNPSALGFSSGGSSSGNAAAIACGDIELAIGCDQGGSVRIPASWSGIVGLKPTHGLVPYTGAFAMDATIDHCGPMANSVEGVARLLTVISGPDGLDSRQRNLEFNRENYLSTINEKRKPKRVAYVKQGFNRPESEKDSDESVHYALNQFKKCGVEVEELDLPEHYFSLDVWSAIVICGTSELMFKNNGLASFDEGFTSPELLEVMSRWRENPKDISVTALPALLMGSYMTEAYNGFHYSKAQSLLKKMRAAYNKALESYDALLMPTIPFTATAMPENTSCLRSTIELALPMVGNTAPFNATGHPAISIPCGKVQGRPVGLMLVGKHFCEANLLSNAYFFESLLEYTNG